MKKAKQIVKMLFIIIIMTKGQILAQEVKDSFEKKFNLKNTGSLFFKGYKSDLKINTWEKEEVKLIGTITIEDGKKAEQESLIKEFKNPSISSSTKKLEIETMEATIITQKKGIFGFYRSVTTRNGNKIETISKFKTEYELWIPKSIYLHLNSRYSRIDIADFFGDADFQLYETKLNLMSFKKAVFDMKYSTAIIGKGDVAKFNVYECEITAKTITTFSTDSKYSVFNIENSKMITVSSYEDRFFLTNLSQGITGKAKYSRFEIKSNIDEIDLSIYQSNVKIENTNKFILSAKYSEVIAKNIETFNVNKLYETRIFGAKIGVLACQESKYDKITLESIKKSIDFKSAYELKLDVSKTEKSLENFSGYFKYGYVEMPLDKDLDIRVDIDINRGKLIYDNKSFPKIEKVGTRKVFKGENKYAKCEIKIKSTDTNFYLK